MGPGFADGIGEALVTVIIAIALVAFGLGMFLMWVLPKLWHWLAPIIHHATA